MAFVIGEPDDLVHVVRSPHREAIPVRLLERVLDAETIAELAPLVGNQHAFDYVARLLMLPQRRSRQQIHRKCRFVHPIVPFPGRIAAPGWLAG